LAGSSWKGKGMTERAGAPAGEGEINSLVVGRGEVEKD
jgi:hypothetical protein